jgi:hypothetical protein
LEDVHNSYRALLAGFLPGIFFGPEDGGDIFLRNVDLPSTDYRALSPRRQYSLVLLNFAAKWIALLCLFGRS